MASFVKYEYEEIYRYFEFKRDDGRDGLAENETLETCSVTCTDSGGNVQAGMIDDVGIVNDTQVQYKLLGGTVGETYTIDVRAVTSNGQKLEGKTEIEVT